ncbi:MAG: hypothetical protein E4H09_04565, partial [Spirochaetales bacterium]
MRGPETRDSGSAHYHYNREERIAGRQHEEKKSWLSLFRRNRSLTITILDVLLLLIVFLLYQFFISPQAGIRRIDGVEFRFTGFSFDDELYITVEVERFRDSRATTPTDPILAGRFPDGTEFLDVIPTVVGQVF